MDQQRYVALDGLRGVAAITVVFLHAKIAGLRFAHGYLAVDLFFMLSGFVIAKSYEPQLAAARLGLRAYMQVRLERLYPLLFLGGAIGLAICVLGLGDAQLVGREQWTQALISQFCLIPFLAMPYFFVFNNAHWSVALELVVNFAHAWLLPRLTNRVLAAIIGGSAALLVLANRHYGTLDLGWTWQSLPAGGARVGFGFFSGVLLFRSRLVWLARVPQVPMVVPALILLAVASVSHEATQGGQGMGNYDCVVVLALLPPLLLLGARASGGPLTAALGTLSFPLYTIHMPIVTLLHRLNATAAQAVAALVVLIVVCWVVGGWVDEPLNAWRRARRREQRPALARAALA